MPWAWIENNRVRDIAPGNPNELYHSSVAVHYCVEVPEGTQRGASLVDGEWVNPASFVPSTGPIVATPVLRKTLTTVEFKLQFNQTERLAFKAARLYQGSDPAKVTQKLVLDDLFEIVDDPRLTEINLDSLQIKEAVESLVLNGLIAQERADQILAGV